LPTLAFNQANALNTALFQRLWVQRTNAAAVALKAAPQPDVKNKVVLESDVDKWSMFADSNGIFATTNSAGLLQDYRSQSGGVNLGTSYQWTKNFSTGVYAGYQGLKADLDNRGRIFDDAVRFGGFGSYGLGGWYVNGLVGGAWHDYEVDRRIAFGTIDRKTRGQTGSGEFNLAVNTGYDVKAGNFTFGVSTGFQYGYLGVQGFQERGARALDLSVRKYDSSSFLYSLGAQAAYRWKVGRNYTVTPTVSASWQHEFLQTAYPIHAGFDSAGPTSEFRFKSSQPQQDYLLAGAGLGFDLGDRWNAAVFWNVVSGGSDLTSQNVYLSFGMKF
jgi:outer membrane autotransporter protein